MVRTGSPSITLEAVNGLDPGEASAILIAPERKADLLLLDERKGRRVAQELGIPVMGALGVILRAKACGLIPAARPLAEALSQFVFLDSLTVELALQSVGEH
jgi:predicted nucleic acid-binding protein